MLPTVYVPQACGVCRRALEALEGLAPADRAFFRRALLPSRPGGGIKQAAAEACPTWNRFAGGAMAKVPLERSERFRKQGRGRVQG